MLHSEHTPDPWHWLGSPRPDGRVITVYEIEEAKCHG